MTPRSKACVLAALAGYYLIEGCRLLAESVVLASTPPPRDASIIDVAVASALADSVASPVDAGAGVARQVDEPGERCSTCGRPFDSPPCSVAHVGTHTRGAGVGTPPP